MARTTVPPSKPSSKSKEYVSDSSEGEVERPIANSRISPEESSESDEDDSDEEPDAAISFGVSSPKKGNSNNVVSKTGRNSVANGPREESDNVQASKDSRRAVVAAIPPKPYQPPQGFVQISSGTSNATPDAELLSNIGDKQLWHIIAPASLPISSLKEFNMTAVSQGQPLLSRGGRSYGISKVKRQAPKQESVLRVIKDVGKFNKMDATFFQSYQIYEMPTTSLTDDSNATHPPFTVTEVVPGRYAKPVRQQPPNLRMRYKPFGTAISSSTESESQEVPYQLPSPPIESPKKKRKKHSKSVDINDGPVPMDVDQSQEPQNQDDDIVDPSSLAKSHATSPESTTKAEKKTKKAEKEKKKKKKTRDQEEDV